MIRALPNDLDQIAGQNGTLRRLHAIGGAVGGGTGAAIGAVSGGALTTSSFGWTAPS
jgi:hypothetical protein